MHPNLLKPPIRDGNVPYSRKRIGMEIDPNRLILGMETRRLYILK